MFQESVFGLRKSIGARAVAFPAALIFHALVVTALILIPLWTTQDLPRINFVRAIFAPPVPPSLPPAGRKQGSSRIARIKEAQRASTLPAGKLVAPLVIPNEISDEPPSGSRSGSGLIGIEGGWENGVFSGVMGDIITQAVGPAEKPVVSVSVNKPPRRIKQVNPVYPEVARLARVEGIVVLEAATDIYGRVVSWRVLKSIPLLDQAAIEAIRQWVYEPMIVNGRPCGVVFSLKVNFTLDK
jgi:protein TonB